MKTNSNIKAVQSQLSFNLIKISLIEHISTDNVVVCLPSSSTSKVTTFSISYMMTILCSHSSVSRRPPVINYRQAEKRILDEILGKNIYDSRLRPPGKNDSCKIFIRNYQIIFKKIVFSCSHLCVCQYFCS